MMKLALSGNFQDHNKRLVPYRLERDEENAARWVCKIDPHGAGQWNAAGGGKNHADALKAARAWWQQYEAA